MTINSLPTLKTVGYTPEIGVRLGVVIDKIGGLRKAAEVAGATDDTLLNWKNGNSRPNLFGVAALAAAAGVSVDWIVTGVEPDESHLAAEVDDDLLYETTRALAKALQERGLHPSPEQFAKMVVLCYRLFENEESEAERDNIVVRLADVVGA